jgi:uncharacterized protein (TIGR02145 family)
MVNGGGLTILQRGICMSTTPNPDTSDYRINSWNGEGQQMIYVTSLKPETEYFIRSYAVNEKGIGYSDELSFTTLNLFNTGKVDIITNNASQITSVSAHIGGYIHITGNLTITERGLCWKTGPNPTVYDTKMSMGADTGYYANYIISLSPNTQYNARAYVIIQGETVYGNEVTFTTLKGGEPTGTITDIEGNIYKTITVGSQVWMAENLKTTKYNNGESISNVPGSEWGSQNSGAYCLNNNEASYKDVFGVLYNWYAVSDPRNICPSGWHIPSNDEWNILINSIGGTAVAGGKLKEAGLEHWNTPNTGAVNEYGFTALPGGYRDPMSTLSPVGGGGYFWSNTIISDIPLYIGLDYLNESVRIAEWPKTFGLNVRCIKN